MNIQIKNTEVLRGLLLHKFAYKLVEVLCWIADNYGLFMTESWRIPYHVGDLHSTDPVRAVDLRHRFYDNPEAVAEAVNKKWKYDPTRPDKVVAFIHENRNSKGIHFHIQVHPNTVEMPDGTGEIASNDS